MNATEAQPIAVSGDFDLIQELLARIEARQRAVRRRLDELARQRVALVPGAKDARDALRDETKEVSNELSRLHLMVSLARTLMRDSRRNERDTEPRT